MVLKKATFSALLFISLLTCAFDLLSTVIIICGTSSAGKSSIIEAFIRLYGENFTAVSGDDFVRSLPKFPRSKREGKKARNKFYTYIKTLSREKNLIIDMVFINDKHYRKLFSALSPENPLLVLIYCPLDKIIERVQERNKSGKSTELRSATSPFRTFSVYYKIAEDSRSPNVLDSLTTATLQYSLDQAVAYDLEPATLALMASKKHISLSKQTKHVLKISKKFLQAFKLTKTNTINIAPQSTYDVVINSYGKTPEEIAKKIFEKIKRIAL